MPYPPPVPPATRTDATVMATNHPADHNLISAALTEILNHLATMEQALYPIGTVTICGSDLPPGNHELLRGQEVAKATYPEVFALIGTKFNTGGEQSFNFRMPDMKGRYPIGYNAGGGYFSSGVGERYGSPDAVDYLKNHTHPIAHEHGVNLYTSYTDVNHTHGVPLPASSGFLVSGVGPSAGIGAGTGYAVTPYTSYATQVNTDLNHRHATNGSTDSGPANSGAAAWGALGNANLPPSVSFNYVMRMH